MSYRVATIDELQDIAYRQDTHMRPVRHHLGITAFGTNAWTAANEGDRLMPEHEEDEGIEELYVVLRGRARFEIDGETVDAPEGTLVFVPPETNRTAFAEEARNDGACDRQQGRAAVRGRRLGGLGGVSSRVRGRRLRSCDRSRPRDVRGERTTPRRSTTLPAARHWPDAPRTRSVTFGSPSSGGRASVSSRRRTPTSTRSDEEPAFRELIGSS